MRIAILSDDYLPNSTRAHAKMLHELACTFSELGHDVVVITPGRWEQSEKIVISTLDNVEIWRFKSRSTRDVGNIKRAINESMLSYRAYDAVKSKALNIHFDLCINYSPTIFFGPFARFLKRNGAYVYLILRDFFPQWIIDQGIISEGSLVARYFKFFEQLNYKTSDCIAVQSPANLRQFRVANPTHPNVKVLFNWASPKRNSGIPTTIISENGLQDKVIFFYGGNIGFAQDMMNIMRLAKGLRQEKNAHILLVGQGDEFEMVEKIIDEWDLFNVTLLPSIPQDEYSRLVANVNVGLFSLSSKHSAHNFPGKLLGYMVESLPILGSVNLGNDLKEIINSSGAGYISENGNDEEYLNNALLLARDERLRKSIGANSYRLLKSHFSVEKAIEEIISCTQTRKFPKK